MEIIHTNLTMWNYVEMYKFRRINNYRIKKSSPENPVNPVQENKMTIFVER
jgi:hypothetical protein